MHRRPLSYRPSQSGPSMGLSAVVLSASYFEIEVCAVVLEALNGAVANRHCCIELIEAEDNMHVIGKDGRRRLAVWLRMSRVASGVRSCGMEKSQEGQQCESNNLAHVQRGRFSPTARPVLEATFCSIQAVSSYIYRHAPSPRPRFLCAHHTRHGTRRTSEGSPVCCG